MVADSVTQAGTRSVATTELLEEPSGTAISLVFPDGLRAELVVPHGIDVFSRMIRPYSWGRLRLGEREVQRDFVIDRRDSERAKALLAAPRLATYERPDGGAVPFVDGRATGMESLDFLVFRFGSWVVAVYDYPADGEFAAARMTDRERALWARHLDGRETDDGWLVLDASLPLSLARPDWGGPPVSIGFEGEDGAVELGHGWCLPEGQDDVDSSDGYVHWCPNAVERTIGVAATGAPALLERLVAALEIR